MKYHKNTKITRKIDHAYIGPKKFLCFFVFKHLFFTWSLWDQKDTTHKKEKQPWTITYYSQSKASGHKNINIQKKEILDKCVEDLKLQWCKSEGDLLLKDHFNWNAEWHTQQTKIRKKDILEKCVEDLPLQENFRRGPPTQESFNW